MLGSTVCAGGRMALRSSGSRALARVALPPRDRLVSFQRIQLGLGSLPSRQGISNARNYWSKPATAVGGASTEPSSQHTSEPAPASQTAAFSATPQESTAAVVASAPTSEPSQTASLITDTVPASVSPSSVLPIDAASNLAEVAANVIPPLQYGDFAALGLATWWPSGIISWTFELLQVSTGMPWFYTIVLGTAIWRIILIPNSLTSMRSAARLRPFTAEVEALDKQAQTANNQATKMEILLKKQKIMETAGVSFGSTLFAPIIQVVLNFSLFFAVRGMTTLPLLQLTQSGVSLLPDLTVTGDYIMPALVLAAMNVQLLLMRAELDPSKPTVAHGMNVMRVASCATLPMMSWMPAGLWLSVCTGIGILSMQSLLLRIPRIRQMVSLPPIVPHPPVTIKDTGRALKDWYIARAQQAAAQNAMEERKPNFTTLPKSRNRRR